MNLNRHLGLGPSEMGRLCRHERVVSDRQCLQWRPIEPGAHSDGPGTLHKDDILVRRMGVRQRDAACVVVNAQNERHARLSRVASDDLEPLFRRNLPQRSYYMAAFLRGGAGRASYRKHWGYKRD